MTDGDLDAARSMLAPELLSALEQDGFFAGYLQRIQQADIRITPFFNEDPLNDLKVKLGRPIRSLFRLTREGAPDLYQIAFLWNYDGYASNVEYSRLAYALPPEDVAIVPADYYMSASPADQVIRDPDAGRKPHPGLGVCNHPHFIERADV